MAILAGDIKLIASQVMDDVPEGGGAPTTTVIQDGTSNSIFNDISELDRAGGRVNLRKVFAHVQTDNTEHYLGSNVILADPPDDPNVSVTIFKTGDVFDERTDARDRVEAYLNTGAVMDGYLFENHIAGQRSIQLFQREAAPLPVIGKTLYLEGSTLELSQYVRVTRVGSELRTFTYSQSGSPVDYTAKVTTVELSDSLRYDFPGSEASRYFTAQSGKTKVRDTVVADAATYYGAVKTTAPVVIGDLSTNVESIFTQLVPSAQTEISLVDRPLAVDTLPVVASSAATVTRSIVASFAPNASCFLPTACWPTSLSLQIGSATLTDDGIGNVIYLGASVGTIDYSTGEISFGASAPNIFGTCTETYRPAAGVAMQAYTVSRYISEETRGYVWVIPLTPIPSPGSLVVSYMAQGDWYQLSDNGLGVLSGSSPTIGVGTVSYTTGTMNVTLGALPDIGSEIIVSWGTPQEFLLLTDSVLAIEPPVFDFDLGGAVAPSSVTFTWLVEGVTKTATDNGSGLITGDATGVIYYGTGTGYLTSNVLPNATSINVEYDRGASEVFGDTVPGNTTSWSGTLPNAPIEPKSVRIDLLTVYTWERDGTAGSSVSPGVIRDDGSGGLSLSGHGLLAGSSINYTTGAIVLALNEAISYPVANYTTVTVGPNIAGTPV